MKPLLCLIDYSRQKSQRRRADGRVASFAFSLAKSTRGFEMAMRCFLLACTFIAASLLSGCNFGPALAPVKGTVTHEGKPLAKGTIRFEGAGKPSATGKIVDGQIVEVTTTKANDGVALGTQKIAIWAQEDAASAVVANPGESGKAGGANYMVGKSLIHTDYNNPDTSGLTADIKSGTNEIKLELFTTPKKK
jgi:hypothetical protein